MNLTIRDLLVSWDEAEVAEFFGDGIRRKNAVMTLSALEELMRRGKTCQMRYELASCLKEGELRPGNDLYTALVNSLTGYGRRSGVLREVAKRMRRIASHTILLSDRGVPSPGTSREKLYEEIRKYNQEIITLLEDFKQE